MLDDRQRLFCRLVAVEGMKRGAAYAQVFGCKANSAATLAGRLLKNVEVQQEIQRLSTRRNEAAEAVGVWSKAERLERLQEWAVRCAEAGDVGTAIRAVAEMNKMDGAHEPERVKVEAEVCTFAAVLARVKAGGG